MSANEDATIEQQDRAVLASDGDSAKARTPEDDSEKSFSGEEDATSIEKSTPPNPWDPSQFPEGGLKAWLVVLGAFCCIFCSFGWVNCGFHTAHRVVRALTISNPTRHRDIPSLLPNASIATLIPEYDCLDRLS